ncbi:MAG: CdaR family protein [Anaerolineae bacterium]
MAVILKFLNQLRGNLVSLVIALLMALTVWILAVQEQNPVVEFELDTPVNIDIEGLEPGLVITNDYPHTARIRLRAQQNTIPSISAEDVVITANVAGLGPGNHQVQLNIDVATQALLVSANPSNIRLEIERLSERTLPVQLRIIGELPTGYEIDESGVVRSPAQVTISGPESRVNLVSEIVVTASVDGLREPFSQVIPLTVLDSSGASVEGVRITPEQVQVDIPIYQRAGFQEVAIRVPTIGRPASGYYMTSRVVTPPLVTIQGDPELLASLPPLINTQPVDINGLTDDLIIEVGLDLPAGVSVVGSPSVQVLITIAAQQDSRSLFVTVKPVGLEEGLEVTLIPEEIEVFLSGPLPVLQTLDPEIDIIVTVDLLGLGPGEYQIEPTVQITQSEISIDSVLPVVIDVKITEAEEGGG